MKTIIKLFGLLLLSGLIFTACNDDENDLSFIEGVAPPSNITALFKITQDNSGLVTITPNAEGANNFTIRFGDGSGEEATVAAGGSVEHIYPEGDFDVSITAENVLGANTEATVPLTVSFLPPENLAVNIQTNGLNVQVSATADLETFFEVDFGEDPEAEPVEFMEGETVEYMYREVGNYIIEVRAFSGTNTFTTFTDTVNIVNPVLLPVDFESTTLEYSFIDFEGATTEVIDNPDPSGLNTSARVARTNKGMGAAAFAGTILELDEPIDFSSFDKFKLKTWSPQEGVVVKFKIENSADPQNIQAEVDAVTSVANQWEELIYDFSSFDLTQEYDRVIVFFDFGNEGAGADYYWDDIELTDQGPEALELPLTFESETLEYTWTNFEGATTTVIENPDVSGINTSANVAATNKGAGAAFFAGSFIELDRPVDFSEFQQIAIKTWSPQAGITVRLKLENFDDNTLFYETDATTTVANQWEELVFDFSPADLNIDYRRLVIFFDFGNDGTGADYFFDDIRVTDGGPTLTLPLDFESDVLEYNWTDFEGANTMVIDNPDPSVINNSRRVATTNKQDGAATFAGSFIELDQPVDFSATQQISIKTWSPQAGIIIRLKMENLADNTIFYETDATTTVADQWEELTFDFSPADLTQTYQRVILFFDFGNPGANTDYFFDDIALTN